MTCINKGNGYDSRRAILVRLVPGELFPQISPASGKNSSKMPPNNFVSKKKLTKLGATLFKLGKKVKRTLII